MHVQCNTPAGQEAAALTSFMAHKHYCENDVEALIGLMDEEIVWLGTGEEEYAVGRENVIEIFRQFEGQVPRCIIWNEEYNVLELAPEVFLCGGQLWIKTDAATGISLRVHQRITTVFCRRGGRLCCCHIHISNPYEDMAPEDTGFPIKMALESYQYLQEQVEEQKRQIAAQTAILERMSYEDTLTGVYNRNKFNETLDAVFEEDVPMGVACFDLNGLKEVNDQWGHSAGDRLICRAAEQLRAVFPGRVYRTGGDEFVVVDRQCGEEEFYAAIRALERELTAHEVSCSVGAVWSSVCRSVKEQYDEADHRMYEEKRRFYSQGQHDRRRKKD